MSAPKKDVGTGQTLGEAYPVEQARLRRLMRDDVHYAARGFIGHAQRVTAIEELLQRADRAVVERDLAEMMKIYQEMQAWQ
jgi:hypothetical protein